MTIKLTTASAGLNGKIRVPGDKSISHRAVMLGSIADGVTVVRHFLPSEDVMHTMMAFVQLGVNISRNLGTLTIQGRSLTELQPPKRALDMGNSGTTTRLLLGLLSKQPFQIDLVGDESLSRRPMARVIDPLSMMGAKFDANGGRLPIKIHANQSITGMTYELPVASAQVKSALIFAAMQADTPTTIIEPQQTRDHTERMLTAFGAQVQRQGQEIVVSPQQKLRATEIVVPGDISSAAFWLVAGLLVPESKITLVGVGINPTRIGIMDLLRRMGAEIAITNMADTSEPSADLTITSRQLHGVDITGEDVPRAIDELPILVLAATQAKGDTLISGAEELRVKETDRIQTVTEELNALGANIEARPDGFLIHGGTPLTVASETVVDARGDHRIGMMLAIAALITTGEVYLANADAVNVSYPTFFDDLAKLTTGGRVDD